MGDYEQIRQETEQLEKKIAASRKACADTTLKSAASSITPLRMQCVIDLPNKPRSTSEYARAANLARSSCEDLLPALVNG